jgi:hypothetical protein
MVASWDEFIVDNPGPFETSTLFISCSSFTIACKVHVVFGLRWSIFERHLPTRVLRSSATKASSKLFRLPCAHYMSSKGCNTSVCMLWFYLHAGNIVTPRRVRSVHSKGTRPLNIVESERSSNLSLRLLGVFLQSKSKRDIESTPV